MTIPNLPIGTEFASNLRDASEPRAYTADKLVTLHDLVQVLKDRPSTEYPMLRSTAAKLSEFYGRSTEEIGLDLLPEDLENFRDYLRQYRYKKNSVRSYMNYANRLIGKAKEMGWEPAPQTTPAAWASFVASAEESECLKVLRHLAKSGLNPSTVEQSDLDDWVQMEVKRGASFAKTQTRAALMRRILVKAGFTSKLDVNKVRKAEYGIPLNKFPDALRAEVEEVLRWKLDRFVPSRPKGAQLRAVTANTLKGIFARLYGFVIGIEGVSNVATIRELVNENNVGRYIAWCLNVRQIRGESLSVGLGHLRAALRQNPKFADIVSGWIDELLNSIPEDPEILAVQRKEAKYLPYPVLSRIPQLIREDRKRIPKDHQKAMALSVRDELMIRWLLTLPWRQRNIRECRVGGRNPNLFRSVVPKMTSVTKPDWLVKAEEQGGPSEVWQFRFAPDETKTGNDIHCVLPERLVPLLEEYLNCIAPVSSTTLIQERSS